MLDAIKHITDDEFFLSGRQRTGALRVCNTMQLREKCDFRVSPFWQLVQKHKLFQAAY